MNARRSLFYWRGTAKIFRKNVKKVLTNPAVFVIIYLALRQAQRNSGGIAQLGAHVTSETTPNLFQKFEKLAVDNLREMFYNMRCWLKNKRAMIQKVLEKVHMGV